MNRFGTVHSLLLVTSLELFSLAPRRTNNHHQLGCSAFCPLYRVAKMLRCERATTFFFLFARYVSLWARC